MSHSASGGASGRLPLLPLRVWRCDEGRASTVRMLSHKVGGLITHFAAKRSYYCDPRTCVGPLHRSPQFWKGYVAAEVYQQAEGLWSPICLEVTEHLELDFRGIYQRGQVWEISRLPALKGKHFPVIGVLLEERDPRTFPHPFDLVPCLRHLYHCDEILLDKDNPLPPRTLVQPSRGDPPLVVKPLMRDGQGGLSPQEQAEAAALVRQFQEQRKQRAGFEAAPHAGKNGTNGAAGKN